MTIPEIQPLNPAINVEEPTLPDFADLWQQTLHWQPSPEQQQQFQQLYRGILSGNQKLNLTRITEPEDFWEKHLWDSLSGIAPWLAPLDQFQVDPSGMNVIDIGTGAGFPGLPIAIARPDWSMTLLDSTRKKIDFLATLIEQLELPNVQPVWGRAEELSRLPNYGQKFDLALIRAVGDLAQCLKYTLPFVKVDGQVVLYRGQWSAADQQALEQSLSKLPAELLTVQAWVTPIHHSDRHCLVVRRTE